MRLLYRISLAFSCLTRIPVGIKGEMRPEDQAFSVYFFPVVGLLVGALSALVYTLCNMAGVYVAAYLMAVLVPVLLTGALHLDGLADTCDALFSVRDRERMLEIMRDPRLGVMGVCGLVFDILLRVVLVAELSMHLTPYSMAMVLTLTPMMGKLSLITGGSLHKYAQNGGMGKHYIDMMHAFHLLAAAAVAAGLLELLFNAYFVPLTVVPMAVGAFASWRFSRRLGGLTGDTLGALNELGEIFFLIAVLVMSRI